LSDRIAVEAGDVRDRRADASFDVVTLYNAIYYFAVEERVAVFRKLASFLKPGGRVIVSTSCQGGSPGMQLLNVWTSATAGFGPLPTPEQIAQQMGEAGFVDVEAKKVIPGEAYYAFKATLASR
jgi:ubiquinone/menaquinone biosynthesis C-methylase UbiE